MALIKLTLSEMSNVKSQISSLAERTESNGTAVARIASNLDMEVKARQNIEAVSYTHLRAHETGAYLVCRLLLEK